MPSSDLIGHLYSHGINKHILTNKPLRKILNHVPRAGRLGKHHLLFYVHTNRAARDLENLITLVLFQVNYVGNIFLLHDRC